MDKKLSLSSYLILLFAISLVTISVDLVIYPQPGIAEIDLLHHLTVTMHSLPYLLATVLSASIYVLGGLSVVTMAYIFWKRDYLATLYVGVGILLLLTIEPLKEIFHRDRPEVHSLTHQLFLGYGFPSGHSLSVMLLTGMLVSLYVKRHALQPTTRMIIFILAGIYILMVGWSRLALFAHFPSDVLGGYVIGLGYLLLLNYFYNWLRMKAAKQQPVLENPWLNN